MNRKIKLILPIALLTGAWMLPRLSHPAVDIGKLKPAEVVQILWSDQEVIVHTDLEDRGRGATLAEAVEDLQRSADGEVMLETTHTLILTGQVDDWNAVYRYFRPACRLCLADQELDLELAVPYLRMHPPMETLGMLRGGIEDFVYIEVEEGRGRFVQP